VRSGACLTQDRLLRAALATARMSQAGSWVGAADRAV